MKRFNPILGILMLMTIAGINAWSQSNVTITNHPPYGKILTDGNGKTLYFFTKDAFGASVCTGACETIWPVFHVDTLHIDAELNTGDFGTIVRPDSSKQTTYKGWPLYYYYGDLVPGDANGQTVNNVWYVAKPNYSIMLVNNQLLGHNGVQYNALYQPGQEVFQYFVDDYGRTLYTFTKDTYNNNNFTTADFSNNGVWPVYEEEFQAAPSVLDTSAFTTIDVFGHKQLTYKGWPLYYFGQDSMIRGKNKGVSFPAPGVWPVAKANIGNPQSVKAQGYSSAPTDYSMEQNYPNPFNPETTIRFAIPKNGNVRLTVFTLLGQQVRTLVNETLNGGAYSVTWDGKNDAGAPISSGVYLYRIQSESFVKTQKMTLLK